MAWHYTSNYGQLDNVSDIWSKHATSIRQRTVTTENTALQRDILRLFNISLKHVPSIRTLETTKERRYCHFAGGRNESMNIVQFLIWHLSRGYIQTRTPYMDGPVLQYANQYSHGAVVQSLDRHLSCQSGTWQIMMVVRYGFGYRPNNESTDLSRRHPVLKKNARTSGYGQLHVKKNNRSGTLYRSSSSSSSSSSLSSLDDLVVSKYPINNLPIKL